MQSSTLFQRLKNPIVIIAGLLFLPILLNAQFDRYPMPKDNKEWKKYFVDSLGKPINDMVYDHVQPFMGGLAVVTKNQGDESENALINASGKMVVPFGTHYLQNELNGFASISDSTGQKLITKTGKLIAACKDCEFTFHEDLKLISVQPRQHYYGDEILYEVAVYNYEGKEIFRKKGTALVRFGSDYQQRNTDRRTRDGLNYFYLQLPERTDRALYNFITPGGKIVFDSVYTMSGHEPAFVNKIMAIGRAGSAAIIDTNFKQILPFTAGYSRLYELWNHPVKDAYSAEKNGKFGVINLKNEIIVPFNYPYSLGYSDSLYTMQKGYDSIWVFNLRLDTIQEPGYMRLGLKDIDQSTGLFKDPKTYLTGIMQLKSKKIIVPAVYNFMLPVAKDSLFFFKGDSAGYLNNTGRVIFRFPAPCYGASQFINGRAFCVIELPGGKVGASKTKEEPQIKYVWLDQKGKIINNAVFDWFTNFNKGKAFVNNNGLYYMVDTLMRHIKVQGKYEYRSCFNNGYAVIGTETRKFGLVDSTGKIIIPVEYDGIGTISERGAADEYRNIQNGVSFYDRTGAETVSNGFCYFPEINDGVIVVSKGESEEEIVLFGDRTPQKREKKKQEVDTLGYWYNYDEDLIIRQRDLDRMHVPLNGNDVVMIPFRQDSLFGFVNKKTGNWMIKPTYDQVFAVYKDGAIVKINESYGFVDTLGKLLFHGVENIIREGNIYHCISMGYNDEGLPEPFDRYIINTYYNGKGKLLFTEKAHNIVSFSDTDSLAYFRYGKTISIRGKSGKLWHRARMDGDKILLGVYNNLLVYKTIVKLRTYYSAYNVKGKLVFSLPLGFDYVVGPFKLSDNLYGLFAREGLYFVNEKGVQKSYGSEAAFLPGQAGKYFKSKTFSVLDFAKKKYGVIDVNGKVLVPFKYKYIGNFKNGYAVFRDSADAYGLIDSLGKPALYLNPQTIESMQMLGKEISFYEGLCPVQSYCELWREDVNGKKQRAFYHDSLCYSFIDVNGNKVISLSSTYPLAGFFSDGLAPVLDDKGNFGFIDNTGKVIIPFEYEAMYAGAYPFPFLVVPEFKNGYAYIQSYKGYIDKTGKKYFSGKRLQDEFDFSH